MNREEKQILSSMRRRDFLHIPASAALAALAGSAPKRLFASKIEPTADTLIVLWMAGGMAQTETFDPKRYTPYETGLESNRVLSTFPSIDTSVDGIKISQGLEKIARVMDRGTLIRSYQAGDLGFILHARHQFQWHTGYAPPQTVAVPHIGSVISRTLGPKNPDMPAFIDIGQNMEIGSESDGLKAFHGRLPRRRVRTVSDSLSRGRGGQCAPAVGDERRAVQSPPRDLQKDGGIEPRG